KGQLTRDDFVVVDDSGLPAWSNQPKSSAETLLHVACVRENPHVNAVLHTHSTWGTLLSDLYFEQGFLSIEGYEMLKGLSGIATHETDYRLLIVENTQDIPVLAEQLSRRWRDDPRSLAHGYLIRRHGLYTWGRDVDEARRHIEIFEFLFEVLGRRVMLTGKC
ncbi:MAG: methylthioribulose 1-phosphate dehydratase, partial [Planctomycetales bacterium]|nr:methylthioribulose 1-phosphate dehydratase [Planctomycetales bacterium]